MNTQPTLHQQRKKLNLIFDNLINNKQLSEIDFDKAMQEWITANKKLEAKEELYDCRYKSYHQNLKNLHLACFY